ncbi:MAG: zonular occludens toxin domain-containing protein [Planctomycetaceae bacterium]|jgi:hypothetical protein|nr:zonular occludens toxin domain-containing protein [Planctomycetaceae bacterium]
MSLSLIVGKPGSGKSYYSVKWIIRELTDYCVFERDHNEQFERVIYTNLILNVDLINDYISNSIGSFVDVSKYLFFMDNDFFFDVDRCLKVVNRKRWWQDIPEGAFCFIDEVHHYLGSDSSREDKEYFESFRNYISTHRHFKHDHVFITQHSDSIHRSVLCMAADAYHIINIKNKVVPILNIPFSDFDVVKESFGVKSQYIQVLYGNYLSRSFKRESVFYEILVPSIFVLYRSHTLTSGVSEDRPSLKLSPFRAILWFLGRHGFSLLFKIGFCVLCFFLAWRLLISIPDLFGGFLKFDSETKVESKLESPKSELPKLESNVFNKKNESFEGKKVVDDKILGCVSGGVITFSGIKKIGDSIFIDGEKRIIRGVDVLSGVIKYDE